MTGSSRLAQEAREQAATLGRAREVERRRRELDRKRLALQAQIAALQSEFASEEEEIQQVIREQEMAEQKIVQDRVDMARTRKADAEPRARPAGRQGVPR
jgi:circadian clock protein KaiC